MDVNAITVVCVTSRTGIRNIPTGIAGCVKAGIVAVVIDGLEAVNTVQDRSGSAGLITGRRPVGIVRDRRTVFAVENDFGIAIVIRLNNDTDSLCSGRTAGIHILIRIVVIRSTLEHKDD